MTALTPAARCRSAIGFETFTTRCGRPAGHTGMHEGNGLAEVEYQQIEWFDSDDRCFETDRDDTYAWQGE